MQDSTFNYGGSERVKSPITLGTPHHGTPICSTRHWIDGGRIAVQKSHSKCCQTRDFKTASSAAISSKYSSDVSLFQTRLYCSWWGSVLRPHQNELYKKNIIIPNVGHTELTHHSGVYMEIKSE